MRDVQSLLGFINFYGEFISNSTHLTAPIYSLTVGKKGTEKVTVKTDELAVFQSLKRALFWHSAGASRPLEAIRRAH